MGEGGPQLLSALNKTGFGGTGAGPCSKFCSVSGMQGMPTPGS